MRVDFSDVVSPALDDVVEGAGADFVLLKEPNGLFEPDVSVLLLVPDGLDVENPRLNPERLELDEEVLELLANAPEVHSIKATIQTAHFDLMCIPFLFGCASAASGIGSARIARNVVC